MGKKFVATVGTFAFALAIVASTQAADPVVKCQSSKLKAAGKKASGKLGCYAKAKAKSPFVVDLACLTKAETSFSAAMTKAGTACGGSAAVIEGLFEDMCLPLLLGSNPTNDKCGSSSAKAEGKGVSGELGCVGKGLSKPGTESACRSGIAAKTSAALGKAGNCAVGAQAYITQCVDRIKAEVLTPCCSAERITLVSPGGGTLKVGGFAPFPFPAGVATIMDAGAPNPECQHAVTLPPGGFVIPPFCIPALQYTSQVTTNGCESGTGVGRGQLWDGNSGSHGGLPYTNVNKNADSSDGVCDNSGLACANRDLNLLGDVDETFSTGGAGNKVATILDIPAHSRTWQDSAGCPGDGIYNPADGDSIITEFDFVLSPTTGQASGAFVDKNADGCALPAGSAGFGAPSAECGSGAAGPCNATGVQANGPCCVIGDTTTTALVGEAFSNSFPLYDLGFISVTPSTVTACGTFVSNTCVVSTDACKK
jgi:hypothetical protein